MNPMPDFIPMLMHLRLYGILDAIENPNRQAIEEKLSYMDFLATTVTDEIAFWTLSSGSIKAIIENKKEEAVSSAKKRWLPSDFFSFHSTLFC
jgi:hypothetical protein